MNSLRQTEDDVNKSERVYGQVSESELDLIQRAARKDRRSQSGFVAKAAVDRAEEVLDDEDKPTRNTQ